jgi:hypothetical protein
MVQEHPHNLDAAARRVGRIYQWCHAGVISGIYIRTSIQEEIDQLLVAVGRGAVERGLSGSAPRINICASIEEQVRDLGPPEHAGPDQRSVSPGIPPIDRSALIQ